MDSVERVMSLPDRNPLGREDMIRSILLPLLFVSGVAVAGSTSSTPSNTTSASTSDHMDFDQMDKNKDGMIDRIEARASEHANAMFDQIDNDKNGSISRAEADVWKKERAYAAGENDKALFTKLDANKDRQIDKTEASAAADVLPQFSFADDDSNGKLSETEWMKYRQETAARADEKGKEVPKAGDMNDDKNNNDKK
jgi:hypothetical protein